MWRKVWGRPHSPEVAPIPTEFLHIQQTQPVIAKVVTDHIKTLIVQQLKEQSCINTTSTDLAIVVQAATDVLEVSRKL